MTDVRKAVILARGLGTRMRQAMDAVTSPEQARVADSGVKALIPVGRPFLDYVLGTLAEAGLTEVCLVVGPEHEALRERYGPPRVFPRLAVSFAIQERARGTADAVLAAEAFCGGDHVVVVNSDNDYPIEALVALRELDGPGLAGFARRGLLAGNLTPERVAAFARLEVGTDRRLVHIVERPDANTTRQSGEDALVSMNCWRFDRRIFAACRQVGPSARGELELPSAVQRLVDEGTRFTVVPFDVPVLDLSTRKDIEAVGRALSGRSVAL